VRIESLLARLDEEQARLARSAIGQPQNRDAFEYGRVVGMYAGLEQAKSVLIELVAEKDRKDLDL